MLDDEKHLINKLWLANLLLEDLGSRDSLQSKWNSSPTSLYPISVKQCKIKIILTSRESYCYVVCSTICAAMHLEISPDMVPLDTFFHTRDSLKFIIHILFYWLQRTSCCLSRPSHYCKFMDICKSNLYKMKESWGWRSSAFRAGLAFITSFIRHPKWKSDRLRCFQNIEERKKTWTGYTISVRNWTQACWSWGSFKRMTHKHGGSLEAGRPGACSRGRDYIHDLVIAQRESYSDQINYELKSQLLVCCILGSKKAYAKQ